MLKSLKKFTIKNIIKIKNNNKKEDKILIVMVLINFFVSNSLSFFK